MADSPSESLPALRRASRRIRPRVPGGGQSLGRSMCPWPTTAAEDAGPRGASVRGTKKDRPAVPTRRTVSQTNTLVVGDGNIERAGGGACHPPAHGLLLKPLTVIVSDPEFVVKLAEVGTCAG